MNTVAVFYDSEEAHVVHGLLVASGIKAVLADGQALSVLPSYRIALGGYRIMAPKSQISAACDIIVSAMDKNIENLARCLKCDSINLRSVRGLVLPFVIAVFGAIIPFAGRTNKHKCRSCGHVQVRD